MQFEHEITQAGGGGAARLLELADARLELGVVDAAAQELQVHDVRGHDLDRVVVHVAGDPLAFLFARFDDRRRAVAPRSTSVLRSSSAIESRERPSSPISSLVRHVRPGARGRRHADPARHRDEIADAADHREVRERERDHERDEGRDERARRTRHGTIAPVPRTRPWSGSPRCTIGAGRVAEPLTGVDAPDAVGAVGDDDIAAPGPAQRREPTESSSTVVPTADVGRAVGTGWCSLRRRA